MKKIVSIVGTRPEYIQLGAILPYLRQVASHKIVNTGQHYDFAMARAFFDQLKLKCDYDLKVGSLSHGAQVGAMLAGCEKVLVREGPDAVAVFGDTNSTLAGALAAAKLNIPVVHIEAGMRSYDRRMPEEVNRIIVDHIADLLLCVSKTGVRNLNAEGIAENVFMTGDIKLDLLKKVEPDFSILKKLRIAPRGYYLLTLHRVENIENLARLKRIFGVISKIDKPVIWPIHPRVRNFYIRSQNSEDYQSSIITISPVNYSEMIGLEKKSLAIITDSGGVQKEAYWLRIPCFTLRNSTEYPETVKSGWNKLAGDKLELLPKLVGTFKVPQKHPNFYGDGKAGFIIAQKIRDYLKNYRSA